MEVGDSIDWLPPVWKKELDEERAADRKEEEVIAQHEAEKSAPRLTMHTRYHKSQGDQILCGKYTGTTLSTPNDEEVNCPVCLKLMHPEKKSPAKNSRKTKLFSSVDITALDKHRDEQERKGYMKKFRAAKRAAKFFSGMYLEFANGVDGRYDRFLELYPPNGDDRKYPWTPPQKGYNLPQTEKRFLAQSDAASEEFNKLLDEGIGKGWMTTEPRKKTTVTEEPLSEPAKALAAAEKANKRSKGTNATPAATAATTGLVKMVRIGNTDEFGVFPESCWKYTTANALRIGTRQECEAERDRINAKHIANNNSVENLVAHGDAHQNQQQHPAAGALEKALDSTESVEVSDQQHDEQQCDYSEEQVAAMLAQGSELPEL
jgi:hypothetical protein